MGEQEGVGTHFRDPWPSSRSGTERASGPGFLWHWVWGTFAVLAMVALVWWGAGHYLIHFHLERWLEGVALRIRRGADQMGAWGPILLIALLAAHSVAFFFPMEIPTFAAFSLYGPILGVVIVWVGSMVAAAVSYGLGRVIGPPILRHWARHPRVMATQHVIATLESSELILLRWISLIPYDALNLIFGTCEIPLWRFAWTTGLGVGVTNIAMMFLYDRALHAAWGQFILIGLIVALAAIVAVHRGKSLRDRLRIK